MNWLKCGKTTACCLALVLLLMMLLVSLPALTATPIGKSTKALRLATPVLLELLLRLDELDLLLDDELTTELELTAELATELTTELDELLNILDRVDDLLELDALAPTMP